MKISDKRIWFRELSTVISELIEKISEKAPQDGEIEIKDSHLTIAFSGGAHLYLDFHPENAEELDEFVALKHWHRLYIIPDEDSPGHWFVYVIDPQEVLCHCGHYSMIVT